MSLYFKREYGLLYEEHEDAVFQEFNHHSSAGHVRFSYLKREIPHLIDGETYYDIISPYGFGGPIIVEAKDKQAAYEDFQKAFDKHCQKEKIISEFVRFHVFKNDDLLEWYKGEVVHVGPQIVRDLSIPVEEDMSKGALRDHRRCIKHGLTAEFDETGKCLEEYLAVYYGTMDRNEADDYYYFDKSFFEKVIETLPGRFTFILVRMNEKVISVGLLLYGDAFSYAFLGGTDSDYYSYQPTTFLEIESIRWLKEKGNRYYLLGGGHSGEDGIYQFKRKFAVNGQQPFHVGKTIYNPDIYQKMVAIREQETDFDASTSFFPAYRAAVRSAETAKG